MILLCFALGWRRSELASLDLRDVRWVKEGIVLWLGKSKTDQQGLGRSVGVQRGSRILTCPLRALDEWLAIRGRWSGPLFTRVDGRDRMVRNRMNPDTVRRAVKRGLSLIGDDPKMFGAHSLRAGMITASIESGATETSVMQRTGHKSYENLRRYVRPAQAFKANPLAGVL
jgi:integrase